MKKEIICSESTIKATYSQIRALCEDANDHFRYLNDSYDGCLGEHFSEHILERFSQQCRDEFVAFHKSRGVTIPSRGYTNSLDLSDFSDEQALQYIEEFEHNLFAMSKIYLTEDYLLNEDNLDTNYEGSAHRYSNVGFSLKGFKEEYQNLAKYHHLQLKIDRAHPLSDENQADNKLKI